METHLNGFRIACDCGCNMFRVCEDTLWKASVNLTTGVLECFDVSDSTFGAIYCRKCQKEYTDEDFKGLELDSGTTEQAE